MSAINRPGSSSPNNTEPNPSVPQLSSPNPSQLRLKRHLDHLQLKLHPLLSVATGRAHAAFPRSILAYHLLTEAQLDSLAHWYHQRTPGPLSLSYPAPVIARWDRAADIEDKRRRFGRFIGLKGCDSPSRESRRVAVDSAGSGGDEKGRINNKRRFNEEDMELDDAESQEEVERWIEARVRRAIAREHEQEMWRRKGF